MEGRGVITAIEGNNKKTYNVKPGDIVRIRAGATVYMVNNDNKDKIQIATLFQSISVPGEFQIFYPAGGRDPELYYNAFSDDILEAAFNAPSLKLQRLFKGNRKGDVVKASPEQIRALSGGSSRRAPWLLPPFQTESHGVFNLFNKRPSIANKLGKLYKVDQNDYKQLEELDVAVSFANITRGAMHGPYYNSRATKIAFVVDGRAFIEIVSRRTSSTSGRQQQGSSTSYKRMRAYVAPGDVFVVPAGHPVAIVAAGDQNFQVICFTINAENNKMNPLAGKNNILKQLEREAKELAFDMPSKQVDEILEKQDESWFLPEPPHLEEGLF